MKKLIILLFFVPLFASAQTTHTVAPKETLYSLARKYNVPPKELAAFNNIPIETGLTIGQVIKIPEDYAKKMILYLDKKRLIPLVMKVYDDKGLYEDYMYFGIEINPVFHPDEFTPAFQGYQF